MQDLQLFEAHAACTQPYAEHWDQLLHSGPAHLPNAASSCLAQGLTKFSLGTDQRGLCLLQTSLWYAQSGSDHKADVSRQ